MSGTGLAKNGMEVAGVEQHHMCGRNIFLLFIYIKARLAFIAAAAAAESQIFTGKLFTLRFFSLSFC